MTILVKDANGANVSVATNDDVIDAMGAARDLATRLMQEGETLTGYSEATGTVLPTTATNAPVQLTTNLDNTTAGGGASLGNLGPGRMMWIETLVFGVVGLPAGTQFTFQIGGYGDADSKYPQFIVRGAATAGQLVTLPVRQFFRPQRTERSAIVTTIRAVSPAVATNTTVTAAITVIGVELTDDPHFSAKKTLAVFSDSTDYGKGYGTTRSNILYSHQARDYYRSIGYDIRLISFAQPGRTSGMLEIRDRSQGKFDFLNPTVGIYALGTNDAIGNGPMPIGGYVDSWEANFRLFWSWWSKRYPTKPLFVRSIGPLNNNTDEQNAAQLRSRQASTVATLNSPLLKYIDISTAFDRADTSNFRSNDAVHWSDKGHNAVALVVNAEIAKVVLA